MPVPPRRTIRDCIRNFTPAWYTINMATGVISSLAANFPFGAGSLTLEIISLAFFLLNLVLFIVISAMTAARYWMFPEMWSKMISHPAQSLFVGAFAMGAANLINSALNTHQSWSFGGTGFLYVLWAFWWLDLSVSFLTAFGMLYAMMTTQNHSLSKMVSLWILPMVTLIVASSTGGLLGKTLSTYSVQLAIITTAVSFTALIIGLSMALMIITVYLTRLVLHGPPDAGLILSSFIVLGPLGQGGFSLLVNGQNLSDLLPLHLGANFPFATLAGQTLYAACLCGAWVLWSMGIAWAIIALCSIYAVLKKERVPFGLSYWGMIFPNGVFALLSLQLGEVLGSPFFHYFGAISSIITLILWIFVTIKTIPVIWDTTIFVAPCLAGSAIPPEKMADMTAAAIPTLPPPV